MNIFRNRFKGTKESTEKTESGVKNFKDENEDNNKQTSDALDEYNSNLTTFVSIVDEHAPGSVKGHLTIIAPYLVKIVMIFKALLPLYFLLWEKVKEIWVILEPFHLDELLPAITGLAMCFFGGSFFTLIAAAEAYRMCGYQTSLTAIQDITKDMSNFIAASKEDDKKDADGDGIADVKQISSSELASRKANLFLLTVQPERLVMAFGGLQSGMLAVVATLKLKFVMAVTLGSAIAEMTERVTNVYLLKTLTQATPIEYRQWVKPTLHVVIRTIAVSIAWAVQRVISAYHSAVRGGTMASRNLYFYLKSMGYVKYEIDFDNTIADEVVGYAIGAIGLMWQFRNGFQIPFPLNLLLFPLTIMEYWLMWFVSS